MQVKFENRLPCSVFLTLSRPILHPCPAVGLSLSRSPSTQIELFCLATGEVSESPDPTGQRTWDSPLLLCLSQSSQSCFLNTGRVRPGELSEGRKGRSRFPLDSIRHSSPFTLMCFRMYVFPPKIHSNKY